jgi:uncharacterized protein YjiK
MFKVIHKIVLCTLLLSICSACAQKSEKKKMIYLSEDYNRFPYDIYHADEKYEMKDKLREISALTYYDQNNLLCVNDEKGLIYQYNLKKRKVVEKYDFAKAGDYEGIEKVRDSIYVLRSDGKIYSGLFGAKEILSTKHKTFLTAVNDTEGLGYDEFTNSLLIACKGSPGEADNLDGKRTVYSYSLAHHQLQSKPTFTIDQEQIRKILDLNSYARFSLTLLENINPSSGDLTFQPSAVAVHPISGNIYVIGSVGKLLLVLNRKGEIQALVKLKRKLFRQPEGICFAPDGTMFISNEGKSGKANIYQFRMQKN